MAAHKVLVWSGQVSSCLIRSSPVTSVMSSHIKSRPIGSCRVSHVSSHPVRASPIRSRRVSPVPSCPVKYRLVHRVGSGLVSPVSSCLVRSSPVSLVQSCLVMSIGSHPSRHVTSSQPCPVLSRHDESSLDWSRLVKSVPSSQVSACLIGSRPVMSHPVSLVLSRHVSSGLVRHVQSRQSRRVTRVASGRVPYCPDPSSRVSRVSSCLVNLDRSRLVLSVASHRVLSCHGTHVSHRPVATRRVSHV